MSKSPAFQFYPDKWLSDTKRLSWANKGIYHELLMVIWTQFQSDCKIPDNAKFISGELGCTITEWEEARAEIMCEFRPLMTKEGDFLFSRGLWKEKQKQDNWREKSAKAGKMSGLARREKSIKSSTSEPTLNQPSILVEPNTNSLSLSLSSSLVKPKVKDILSGLQPDAVFLDNQKTTKNFKQEALEILQFLNQKTGRRYKDSKTNLDFIIARLKGGATKKECNQVIAMMCRKWIDDPKMADYLRPATLFNRTNFDQYCGLLGAGKPCLEAVSSENSEIKTTTKDVLNAMPSMPRAI